jgi:hypothetical protein
VEKTPPTDNKIANASMIIVHRKKVPRNSSTPHFYIWAIFPLKYNTFYNTFQEATSKKVILYRKYKISQEKTSKLCEAHFAKDIERATPLKSKRTSDDGLI